MVFTSWESCQEVLLYSYSSPKEMVRYIQELSRIFINRDKKIENYGEDEKLVSAYAAFYLPGHWEKWKFLVSQIDDKLTREIYKADFFDIGSGPGTFSLIWATHSGAHTRAYCLEKSENMAKQGLKMAKGLGVQNKIFFYHNPNEFKKNIGMDRENRRVALFGHSLNEMEVDDVFDLLNVIEPDIIILIEPVGQLAWEKLNILKEKFIFKGDMDIFYPCPHPKNTCPIAIKVSQNDFACHQVVRVKLPLWLENLSSQAKINRRDLGMMAQIWGKKEVFHSAYPQGRLVQSFAPSKHSFKYKVCVSQGQGAQLLEIEEPMRHLTRQEKEQRLKFTAGDQIKWEVDPNSPKKVRLKCLPET